MSHRVQFEEAFNASVAVIFAAMADHQKFGRVWGGSFTRIIDGKDAQEPNGEGSVRRIVSGGLTFEETIVSFEKNQLIEYAVTRGSPIKNHLGSMAFRGDGKGGTRLSYTITFSSKVPGTGWLIAAILRRNWASGMAKHRAWLEAGAPL